MVKSDPAVPLLGVAIGLRVFLALVLLAPLALLISTFPGDVASLAPILAIYPVALIGALVYQIVGLVNLTGQEARRRAAAASSMGARMALAGQPMPPLPPLPMPFTLRLGPNWLFLALLYTPIILVFVGISVLNSTDNDGVMVDPAVGVVSAAIPILIIVGVLALLTVAQRQRLEVNPYDITLTRGFKTTPLYWEQVALFAQVRAVPARREVPRIALYELSNAQTLLRFYVPRSRWSPLLPVGMSLAQYNQQMALLFHYITIRTGLPLLDVR